MSRANVSESSPLIPRRHPSLFQRPSISTFTLLSFTICLLFVCSSFFIFHSSTNTLSLDSHQPPPSPSAPTFDDATATLQKYRDKMIRKDEAGEIVITLDNSVSDITSTLLSQFFLKENKNSITFQKNNIGISPSCDITTDVTGPSVSLPVLMCRGVVDAWGARIAGGVTVWLTGAKNNTTTNWNIGFVIQLQIGSDVSQWARYSPITIPAESWLLTHLSVDVDTRATLFISTTSLPAISIPEGGTETISIYRNINQGITIHLTSSAWLGGSPFNIQSLLPSSITTHFNVHLHFNSNDFQAFFYFNITGLPVPGMEAISSEFALVVSGVSNLSSSELQVWLAGKVALPASLNTGKSLATFDVRGEWISTSLTPAPAISLSGILTSDVARPFNVPTMTINRGSLLSIHLVKEHTTWRVGNFTISGSMGFDFSDGDGPLTTSTFQMIAFDNFAKFHLVTSIDVTLNPKTSLITSFITRTIMGVGINIDHLQKSSSVSSVSAIGTITVTIANYDDMTRGIRNGLLLTSEFQVIEMTSVADMSKPLLGELEGTVDGTLFIPVFHAPSQESSTFTITATNIQVLNTGVIIKSCAIDLSLVHNVSAKGRIEMMIPMTNTTTTIPPPLFIGTFELDALQRNVTVTGSLSIPQSGGWIAPFGVKSLTINQASFSFIIFNLDQLINSMKLTITGDVTLVSQYKTTFTIVSSAPHDLVFDCVVRVGTMDDILRLAGIPIGVMGDVSLTNTAVKIIIATKESASYRRGMTFSVSSEVIPAADSSFAKTLSQIVDTSTVKHLPMLYLSFFYSAFDPIPSVETVIGVDAFPLSNAMLLSGMRLLMRVDAGGGIVIHLTSATLTVSFNRSTNTTITTMPTTSFTVSGEWSSSSRVAIIKGTMVKPGMKQPFNIPWLTVTNGSFNAKIISGICSFDLVATGIVHLGGAPLEANISINTMENLKQYMLTSSFDINRNFTLQSAVSSLTGDTTAARTAQFLTDLPLNSVTLVVVINNYSTLDYEMPGIHINAKIILAQHSQLERVLAPIGHGLHFSLSVRVPMTAINGGSLTGLAIVVTVPVVSFSKIFELRDGKLRIFLPSVNSYNVTLAAKLIGTFPQQLSPITFSLDGGWQQAQSTVQLSGLLHSGAWSKVLGIDWLSIQSCAYAFSMTNGTADVLTFHGKAAIKLQNSTQINMTFKMDTHHEFQQVWLTSQFMTRDVSKFVAGLLPAIFVSPNLALIKNTPGFHDLASSNSNSVINFCVLTYDSLSTPYKKGVTFDMSFYHEGTGGVLRSLRVNTTISMYMPYFQSILPPSLTITAPIIQIGAMLTFRNVILHGQAGSSGFVSVNGTLEVRVPTSKSNIILDATGTLSTTHNGISSFTGNLQNWNTPFGLSWLSFNSASFTLQYDHFNRTLNYLKMNGQGVVMFGTTRIYASFNVTMQNQDPNLPPFECIVLLSAVPSVSDITVITNHPSDSLLSSISIIGSNASIKITKESVIMRAYVSLLPTSSIGNSLLSSGLKLASFAIEIVLNNGKFYSAELFIDSLKLSSSATIMNTQVSVNAKSSDVYLNGILQLAIPNQSNSKNLVQFLMNGSWNGTALNLSGELGPDGWTSPFGFTWLSISAFQYNMTVENGRLSSISGTGSLHGMLGKHLNINSKFTLTFDNALGMSLTCMINVPNFQTALDSMSTSIGNGELINDGSYFKAAASPSPSGINVAMTITTGGTASGIRFHVNADVETNSDLGKVIKNVFPLGLQATVIASFPAFGSKDKPHYQLYVKQIYLSDMAQLDHVSLSYINRQLTCSGTLTLNFPNGQHAWFTVFGNLNHITQIGTLSGKVSTWNDAFGLDWLVIKGASVDLELDLSNDGSGIRIKSLSLSASTVLFNSIQTIMNMNANVNLKVWNATMTIQQTSFTSILDNLSIANDVKTTIQDMYQSKLNSTNSIRIDIDSSRGLSILSSIQWADNNQSSQWKSALESLKVSSNDINRLNVGIFLPIFQPKFLENIKVVVEIPKLSLGRQQYLHDCLFSLDTRNNTLSMINVTGYLSIAPQLSTTSTLENPPLDLSVSGTWSRGSDVMTFNVQMNGIWRPLLNKHIGINNISGSVSIGISNSVLINFTARGTAIVFSGAANVAANVDLQILPNKNNDHSHGYKMRLKCDIMSSSLLDVTSTMGYESLTSALASNFDVSTGHIHFTMTTGSFDGERTGFLVSATSNVLPSSNAAKSLQALRISSVHNAQAIVYIPAFGTSDEPSISVFVPSILFDNGATLTNASLGLAAGQAGFFRISGIFQIVLPNSNSMATFNLAGNFTVANSTITARGDISNWIAPFGVHWLTVQSGSMSLIWSLGNVSSMSRSIEIQGEASIVLPNSSPGEGINCNLSVSYHRNHQTTLYYAQLTLQSVVPIASLVSGLSGGGINTALLQDVIMSSTPSWVVTISSFDTPLFLKGVTITGGVTIVKGTSTSAALSTLGTDSNAASATLRGQTAATKAKASWTFYALIPVFHVNPLKDMKFNLRIQTLDISDHLILNNADVFISTSTPPRVSAAGQLRVSLPQQSEPVLFNASADFDAAQGKIIFSGNLASAWDRPFAVPWLQIRSASMNLLFYRGIPWSFNVTGSVDVAFPTTGDDVRSGSTFSLEASHHFDDFIFKCDLDIASFSNVVSGLRSISKDIPTNIESSSLFENMQMNKSITTQLILSSSITGGLQKGLTIKLGVFLNKSSSIASSLTPLINLHPAGVQLNALVYVPMFNSSQPFSLSFSINKLVLAENLYIEDCAVSVQQRTPDVVIKLNGYAYLALAGDKDSAKFEVNGTFSSYGLFQFDGTVENWIRPFQQRYLTITRAHLHVVIHGYQNFTMSIDGTALVDFDTTLSGNSRLVSTTPSVPSTPEAVNNLSLVQLHTKIEKLRGLDCSFTVKGGSSANDYIALLSVGGTESVALASSAVSGTEQVPPESSLLSQVSLAGSSITIAVTPTARDGYLAGLTLRAPISLNSKSKALQAMSPVNNVDDHGDAVSQKSLTVALFIDVFVPIFDLKASKSQAVLNDLTVGMYIDKWKATKTVTFAEVRLTILDNKVNFWGQMNVMFGKRLSPVSFNTTGEWFIGGNTLSLAGGLTSTWDAPFQQKWLSIQSATLDGSITNGILTSLNVKGALTYSMGRSIVFSSSYLYSITASSTLFTTTIQVPSSISSAVSQISSVMDTSITPTTSIADDVQSASSTSMVDAMLTIATKPVAGFEQGLTLSISVNVKPNSPTMKALQTFAPNIKDIDVSAVIFVPLFGSKSPSYVGISINTLQISDQLTLKDVQFTATHGSSMTIDLEGQIILSTVSAVGHTGDNHVPATFSFATTYSEFDSVINIVGSIDSWKAPFGLDFLTIDSGNVNIRLQRIPNKSYLWQLSSYRISGKTVLKFSSVMSPMVTTFNITGNIHGFFLKLNFVSGEGIHSLVSNIGGKSVAEVMDSNDITSSSKPLNDPAAVTFTLIIASTDMNNYLSGLTLISDVTLNSESTIMKTLPSTLNSGSFAIDLNIPIFGGKSRNGINVSLRIITLSITPSLIMSNTLLRFSQANSISFSGNLHMETTKLNMEMSCLATWKFSDSKINFIMTIPVFDNLFGIKDFSMRNGTGTLVLPTSSDISQLRFNLNADLVINSLQLVAMSQLAVNGTSSLLFTTSIQTNSFSNVLSMVTASSLPEDLSNIVSSAQTATGSSVNLAIVLGKSYFGRYPPGFTLSIAANIPKSSPIYKAMSPILMNKDLPDVLFSVNLDLASTSFIIFVNIDHLSLGSGITFNHLLVALTLKNGEDFSIKVDSLMTIKISDHSFSAQCYADFATNAKTLTFGGSLNKWSDAFGLKGFNLNSGVLTIVIDPFATSFLKLLTVQGNGSLQLSKTVIDFSFYIGGDNGFFDFFIGIQVESLSGLVSAISNEPESKFKFLDDGFSIRGNATLAITNRYSFKAPNGETYMNGISFQTPGITISGDMAKELGFLGDGLKSAFFSASFNVGFKPTGGITMALVGSNFILKKGSIVLTEVSIAVNIQFIGVFSLSLSGALAVKFDSQPDWIIFVCQASITSTSQLKLSGGVQGTVKNLLGIQKFDVSNVWASITLIAVPPFVSGIGFGGNFKIGPKQIGVDALAEIGIQPAFFLKGVIEDMGSGDLVEGFMEFANLPKPSVTLSLFKINTAVFNLAPYDYAMQIATMAIEWKKGVLISGRVTILGMASLSGSFSISCHSSGLVDDIIISIDMESSTLADSYVNWMKAMTASDNYVDKAAIKRMSPVEVGTLVKQVSAFIPQLTLLKVTNFSLKKMFQGQFPSISLGASFAGQSFHFTIDMNVMQMASSIGSLLLELINKFGKQVWNAVVDGAKKVIDVIKTGVDAIGKGITKSLDAVNEFFRPKPFKWRIFLQTLATGCIFNINCPSHRPYCNLLEAHIPKRGGYVNGHGEYVTLESPGPTGGVCVNTIPAESGFSNLFGIIPCQTHENCGYKDSVGRYCVHGKCQKSNISLVENHVKIHKMHPLLHRYASLNDANPASPVFLATKYSIGVRPIHHDTSTETYTKRWHAIYLELQSQFTIEGAPDDKMDRSVFDGTNLLESGSTTVTRKGIAISRRVGYQGVMAAVREEADPYGQGMTHD